MAAALPPPAALIREALVTPRASARRMLGLGLPLGTVLAALGLSAVASTFIVHLSLVLVGSDPGPEGTIMFPAPLPLAVMQLLLAVLMAGAVHIIGTTLGGRGTFGGALVVVAWLQLLLVVVQIAQTVFVLVLPPLGFLASMLAIAVFFWLLTHFVAELHGFNNTIAVFFGIIAAMVGLSLMVAIALALLFGAALTGGGSGV
jgi:hypothetical protein